MEDHGSVEGRDNKTPIRWMWKKAFKSLKTKDREKEKQALTEPSPVDREEKKTYSRMNSRQSSVKKGGLLKRKDSKDQATMAEEEELPETTDQATGDSADPIFATLKFAAKIKKGKDDASCSDEYY